MRWEPATRLPCCAALLYSLIPRPCHYTCIHTPLSASSPLRPACLPAVFSFTMGFYDLLKALPGLQTVMQRLMASVWLPPAAVLEWLEQHTQIRWVPSASPAARALLLPLYSTRKPASCARLEPVRSAVMPWPASIACPPMPTHRLTHPLSPPTHPLSTCRLSILLTYLLGKSEGFVWLARHAQHFARVSGGACPSPHTASPHSGSDSLT